MSSHIRVIEPHPDTSVSRTIYTGRGGAGNAVSLRNTKTTAGQTATGPASLTALNAAHGKSFTSGRGGAGNVHSSSERAIFSFDEELESQMRREKQIAPVFHVGRGGAGNLILGGELADQHRRLSSGRKPSDAASVGSAGSDDSVQDRAKERARKSLERGWEKLVGGGRSSTSRER